SSRDGASIVAVLSSPFTARAVYVNVGIVCISLGISLLRWEIGNRESTGRQQAAIGADSGFPTSLFPSCSRLLLVQPTRQRLVAVARAASVVERHPADHAEKLVRIAGHAKTFLVRYLAAHVELVERVVERLHAVLLSRLHQRIDL